MKKKIFFGIGAAIVVIAAIFLLWWKGAFLPSWVEWKNKQFEYEDAVVTLEHRTFTLNLPESETKGLGEKTKMKTVFKSNWDWEVQDVLVRDINHDGSDELILLVWKHGSFGKHRPLWVKHNDIRLEQHLFIYQWEEERDYRLRAVWMSSALDYEVKSIAIGRDESIILNDLQNNAVLFRWAGFGLKDGGAAKEYSASFEYYNRTIESEDMIFTCAEPEEGSTKEISDSVTFFTVNKIRVAVLNKPFEVTKDKEYASEDWLDMIRATDYASYRADTVIICVTGDAISEEERALQCSRLRECLQNEDNVWFFGKDASQTDDTGSFTLHKSPDGTVSASGSLF